MMMQMFRKMAATADKKRDKNLVFPDDIEAICDINYAGNEDEYNNLDVYYPKGTEGKLPVIVSFHGGGYVYGTKEIYKHYGGYMAGQGFVFVNFNYHLAPDYKFPTQLNEANMVFQWIDKNAYEYYMDIENVFVVGDSAGAQMISQYLTIYSNEEYEKLFPFVTPKEIKIRAAGLNCGMYTVAQGAADEKLDRFTKELTTSYLGKDYTKFAEMNNILPNITSEFPPSYVMTAEYDFLKENAQPMCDFLLSKGVEAVCKCYGTPEQKYVACMSCEYES